MVSKICEILIIDTRTVLKKTIPVQLTCSNHHLLGYSPSDLLENMYWPCINHNDASNNIKCFRVDSKSPDFNIIRALELPNKLLAEPPSLNPIFFINKGVWHHTQPHVQVELISNIQQAL